MKFKYGKEGIELTLNPNWNTTIIQPFKQSVIENPIEAVRDAIKNPVGSLPLQSIVKNLKSIKRCENIDITKWTSDPSFINVAESRVAYKFEQFSPLEPFPLIV